MKGSPLREFLLVLLAGCLLALPLFCLTRPDPDRSPAPGIATSDRDGIPAWFSLRFSHAPERFTLRQGETVLALGGGLLRVEDDIPLHHNSGHLILQLSIQWPDAVENAYAELALEPEEWREQRQGFWAAGTVTRFLEFTWTPPSL